MIILAWWYSLIIGQLALHLGDHGTMRDWVTTLREGELETTIGVEPFLWPRPKKGRVHISHGLVCPGKTFRDYIYSENDYYEPFDCPGLPNALAKVRTESHAVKFVQTYGLLGFTDVAGVEVINASSDVLSGVLDEEAVCEAVYEHLPHDPPEWFLSQAQTVRFALDLIKALGCLDDKQLIATLEDHSVDLDRCANHTQHHSSSTRQNKTSIFGGDVISGVYVLQLGEERPNNIAQTVIISTPIGQSRSSAIREHAYALLALMVNRNTKAIRLGVRASSNGLVFCREARALIEVIWYHIGEMALLIGRGKNRLTRPAQGIRMCEECGLPFVVTDRRQRFCPPDFGSKSLCATRARQRRLREKTTRSAAEES